MKKQKDNQDAITWLQFNNAVPILITLVTTTISVVTVYFSLVNKVDLAIQKLDYVAQKIDQHIELSETEKQKYLGLSLDVQDLKTKLSFIKLP